MYEWIQGMDLPIREVFRIFDADDSGEISKAEFMDVIDTIYKGCSISEKEHLAEIADVDKDGLIQFDEFLGLFSDLNTMDDTEIKNLTTAHQKKNIYYFINKSFAVGIDISELWLKKDDTKEGNISKQDFINILKWLPLGLLENDITKIMNEDVTYISNSRVDYLDIMKSSEFEKMFFTFNVKREIKKNLLLSGKVGETKFVRTKFTEQKCIIESCIFLDDFNILVFTTLCPHTSTIFITSTEKEFEIKGEENGDKKSTDIFANQLLAKLVGSSSSLPPTIAYIPSACVLIAGDKIDKTKQRHKTASKEVSLGGGIQKEKYISFYEKIDVNKNFSCDILIYNL